MILESVVLDSNSSCNEAGFKVRKGALPFNGVFLLSKSVEAYSCMEVKTCDLTRNNSASKCTMKKRATCGSMGFMSVCALACHASWPGCVYITFWSFYMRVCAHSNEYVCA